VQKADILRFSISANENRRVGWTHLFVFELP
jgi:hypothetical protein